MPSRRASRLAPWIALALGALVLAAMALSIATARTHGTLVLRCTQRCELGAIACPAGGEITTTLPPGEHELLIHDPGHAPIRRPITIDRGQVTLVECAADLARPGT